MELPLSLWGKTVSFCLVWILFGMACTTTHCRRDGNLVIPSQPPTPPVDYERENLGYVEIYKFDGSLQCQMKAGEGLKSMAQKDLKGVRIFWAGKRHDGLFRKSLCGEPTGMMNTYRIRRQDLPRAYSKGFKVEASQGNRTK